MKYGRALAVSFAAHRVRLELGMAPITTAPVVAQTSRTGRQAQLRRLLRGCEVMAFACDWNRSLDPGEDETSGSNPAWYDLRFSRFD